MAIYQVQANGDAPKGTAVGDYVVTAGGTYQVLDGSKYSSMSKEELAANNVSYNPSSGLYSTKVSAITPQEYVPMDTSKVDAWRDANNKNSKANLQAAYVTNKQNIDRTYNNSLADYEKQQDDVRQKYLDNMVNLYEDTYYNNAKALENASSRGLTSSGLGNAMVVSGLADASNQNAYYRATRDNELNRIASYINALTNNYNVDLDALDAKLSADTNASLSQNEIAYLNALLSLEQYNNQTYNDVLKTKQQQEYEKEMYLLQLANSRSYGGYGGYGGSYRKSGSGDSAYEPDDYARAAYEYDLAGRAGFTDTQLKTLEKYVYEIKDGKATLDDMRQEMAKMSYANSYSINKNIKLNSDGSVKAKKSVRNSGSSSNYF